MFLKFYLLFVKVYTNITLHIMSISLILSISIAAHYFEEINHFLDTYKLKVEDEKKEIAECQKKFSSLLNSFSQKVRIFTFLFVIFYCC